MSRPTKPSQSTTARRTPGTIEPISSRPMRMPTQQEISVRAYEIFIARGAQHGRDQEDWYQAENELRLGRQ